MFLVKRDTVRSALLTSVAAIAFAAPGYAQAPTQQRDAAASERQQVAQFMEDLRMSVGIGASAMLRQVRLEAPKAEFELANPVEVELFKLPEGDLLFRVRVPTMAPTLKWAWELMQPQRTRRGGGPLVTPTNVTTPASTNPNSTPAPAVQALPAQPSPYVDIDPDEVYTNEVKAALKKTLIERSKGIRVPPDRFLTVAARDDGRPDPRFSSSFREFNTVYFSIKGRDLANYHDGSQTFEETEKLVILREE